MDDTIYRRAAIEALMAWEEDSFWDEECLKHRGEPYWVAPSDVINQLPSAQPDDWMERNKERILQAGMEGREIEFRIGGRLFAIREKAQ